MLPRRPLPVGVTVEHYFLLQSEASDYITPVSSLFNLISPVHTQHYLWTTI